MNPTLLHRKGSLQIIGTGAAITDPSKIIDNEQVLENLRQHGVDTGGKVGLDTENLTGIAYRSLDDRDSFDFALDAAKQAIEAAQEVDPDFDPVLLDLMYSGGSTPDWVYPACACRLQGALFHSLTCEALDISLACSSGIAALNLAASRMRDKGFKYGLVAVGESIGTRSNTADSLSNCLWGNGGGAFVLRWEPDGDPHYGLLDDKIISDGQYAAWTKSVGIGTHPSNIGQAPNASMEGHGKDIHRYGLQVVSGAIRPLLDKNFVEEPFYLIAHHANLKLQNGIGERIGLPSKQVLSRITEQGNTSSASILTCLDYFARRGMFAKGDLLLFAAFGGGMSIALSLYRWPY